MNARPFLACLILAISFGAGTASAQDDDLLSPLTPAEKASKPKRKRKPAPVQKEASDELVAPLPATTKASIAVNLVTSGKGARLFIDGAEIGPINPGNTTEQVSPGSHKLVIRRPGFKDYSLTVPTRAGDVAQVSVALEPVAGVLAVQANVPLADVLIDGQRVGQVPLKGVELPPGNHEVQVRREGYTTDSSRLSVHVGKEYEVRANLKPVLPDEVARADRPAQTRLIPVEVPTAAPGPLEGAPPPEVEGANSPWYGRWYVWAGAGAVAVATTVGVVLATQPRSLDPNRDVCHGTCSAVINDPRHAAAILGHF